MARSNLDSTKKRWIKLLLVPLFFLIGEAFGVAMLPLWLRNFGMHVVFAWPRNWEECLPFVALAWNVVFIPIGIAELGSRLIDTYL